jgi:hypothetical protein
MGVSAFHSLGEGSFERALVPSRSFEIVEENVSALTLTWTKARRLAAFFGLRGSNFCHQRVFMGPFRPPRSIS